MCTVLSERGVSTLKGVLTGCPDASSDGFVSHGQRERDKSVGLLLGDICVVMMTLVVAGPSSPYGWFDRDRGGGTWAMGGCCDNVQSGYEGCVTCIRMRVSGMVMCAMCHHESFLPVTFAFIVGDITADFNLTPPDFRLEFVNGSVFPTDFVSVELSEERPCLLKMLKTMLFVLARSNSTLGCDSPFRPCSRNSCISPDSLGVYASEYGPVLMGCSVLSMLFNLDLTLLEPAGLNQGGAKGHVLARKKGKTGGMGREGLVRSFEQPLRDCGDRAELRNAAFCANLRSVMKEP
ncbi:hypothetical protein CK203_099261 [Vitis vinifera]|uniref:Uncharacterized protein n=1 Tax=Vitis vinifera TaxID=29760 RepID=A0A438CTV4_VITVI|nr:hypothetical protein CK203_099261 [Vitis vinifera]